ncbi:hypothetical protein R8510_05134 [Ralstonia chuxiongensis]|nr:hypothetical protein R8510_05134 [Ralstonia chuxiongensis]
MARLYEITRVHGLLLEHGARGDEFSDENWQSQCDVVLAAFEQRFANVPQPLKTLVCGP